MIDLKELNEAIDRYGVKRTWISAKLGRSRQNFYNQLAGKTGISTDDALIIIKALRLSDDEAKRIFFADKVDVKSSEG